jgi:Tfp pilus assembly protein FimT
MFTLRADTLRADRIRNASSPGRHGRARVGFTMLELMVTLGLVALLAVLARPMIAVDRVQADATAHRVRATLQQAQRMALVQQHNIMVSFDTLKHRIRVVEDVNNDRYLNSGERIRWYPLEEANGFATPPVRISGAAAAAAIWGNNLIPRNGYPTAVFRRDGSLSTELEVYLRSRQGGRDSRRAVTVSAGSGRADWLKYVPPSKWSLGGA